MDMPLKSFIMSTALRHAGKITTLPDIRLLVPAEHGIAAVETTVDIMYSGSLAGTPQVHSGSIRLDLHRVPQAGPTTMVSPIFNLPNRPTYLDP